MNELSLKAIQDSNRFKLTSGNHTFFSIISGLAIYTGIFSGYHFMGTILISYAFVFFTILVTIDKLKLSRLQYFSILLILIYSGFALALASNKFIVAQNIRFWLGLIIYVIFFSVCHDYRLISKIIVRLLCFSILFESLLVNTVLDGTLLQGPYTEINRVFVLSGWYKRPEGFTGVPGTSGIVLLTLFFLTEKLTNIKASKFDLILILITTISLFSTTATLGFAIMLLLRSYTANNFLIRKKIIYLFSTIVIIASMVYISTTTIIGNIQAFSIEYVQKIYNLNINQLLSFSFKNSISFMFGDQIYEKFLPHTAGDFG